jgi:hypothetical protein
MAPQRSALLTCIMTVDEGTTNAFASGTDDVDGDDVLPVANSSVRCKISGRDK